MEPKSDISQALDYVQDNPLKALLLVGLAGIIIFGVPKGLTLEPRQSNPRRRGLFGRTHRPRGRL